MLCHIMSINSLRQIQRKSRMMWRCMLLVCVLTALLIEPALAKPKSLFCPALKQCKAVKDDVPALFACLGRLMYAKPHTSWNLPQRRDVLEHNCGGVGWGNALMGLGSAASLSLLFGSRLHFVHPALNRLFLSPFPEVAPLVYQVDWSSPSFDYAKHGQGDRWQPFVNSVWLASTTNRTHTQPTHAYDGAKTLKSGMCGMDRGHITEGACTGSILSTFNRCAENMPDTFWNAPFVHSLFSRPAPEMVRILSVMRRRIRLPALQPGVEPVPGAHGLRTPGYFIIAFHFRRIPLGFEPLAVSLNEQQHLSWRMDNLAGMWDIGQTLIRKAADIARCRNQTLLIYFATDDPVNLRPIAKRRWSGFGRVVFGPRAIDIGHMSPQWTERDIDVERKRERSQPSSTPPPNDVVIPSLKNPDKPTSSWTAYRSEHVAKRHADWGFAEWWVLANVNWLVAASGSNYATTSIAHGLGPNGGMERFDLISGASISQTTFRRNWTKGLQFCTRQHAMDATLASQCPHSD